MKPHKNRFAAALLAFVFGGLGAHRFYLASHRWWWYSAWLIVGMLLFATFANPVSTWLLVFALLPVWMGFVEAMAFGVMPDEKWDARFNSESQKRSENGWNCVFIAILSLLVGTTIFMTTVILAAQYYYEATTLQ
jgi:TM2 domain-containing membrane protein YozV